MRSIEPVATPRPHSTTSVRLTTPLTLGASGTALVTASAGMLPTPAAFCCAVALPTAVYGFLLARLALAIHTRRHSFGPCRGAGFLCLGVLAAGTGAGLAGWLDSAHGRSASLAGGLGLSVATLLYLLGLLLLPGTAPTPIARLRRALDGLGIGLCFLLTAWLMVIAPQPDAAGRGLAVALITCAGLAIAIMTGLRAVRYRPAALACCCGAALSILGTAATTLLVGQAGPPSLWLPVAGLAAAAGPALCWAGARHAEAGPEPGDTLDVDPGFAGYPIMVVPVGSALAAAGYHVATGRGFDQVSAALGLGVLGVLAVREAFAVTDIRRYARRLATQEAHFRSLVSGSSDVTIVLDSDLVVRWQSPAAARQFGLSDQDVVGRPVTALVHPDDVAHVRDEMAGILSPAPGEVPRPGLLTARLRDGFGRWRDTESTVSDQRAVPAVGALVVHVRDVGQRRDLERTLHRMAFTDQLTGLANRRQLLRTLAAMREVPGRRGALLMIDLGGFTAVNDVRGHHVGDAVLIEAARRLRDVAGDGDLPARLSGDEFAITTTSCPVQAYALASRVRTELSAPYDLPGATVRLTVSIGLAELAGAADVGDVLSRAGQARHRARLLRPGGIEWYDEALEAALRRRVELEQELPGAVGRGELDLVYQPVVDLVDEVPVGVTAVLRWRHPRLGTVPAADFVPVAEGLGIIDEIGEWVLHRACRQLSGWLRDGHRLWLAVALAASQLTAADLVAGVATALETHQVPADRLVLEVTEQGISSDTQRAVTQLAGLRALGVRTALAQFGTGAIPLAHLRRLPVDVLTVDRALFTEPAGRSGPATPILDVVVSLGRRLGLEIVAEGLEAPAHLTVVRAAGCRYGQGVLFGRPQPAEHFEALLETYRSAAG